MHIDLLTTRLPPGVFEKNIPNELLLEIFTKIPPNYYPQISLVNWRWHKVAQTTKYWRVAFGRAFPDSNQKIKSRQLVSKDIYKKLFEINKAIKKGWSSYFTINVPLVCKIFIFENYLVYCSEFYKHVGSTTLFFKDLEGNFKLTNHDFNFLNSNFINQKNHESNLVVCLSSGIHIFHSNNRKIDILKSISLEQLGGDGTTTISDFDIDQDTFYIKFSNETLIFFNINKKSYLPVSQKTSVHHPGTIIGRYFGAFSSPRSELVIKHSQSQECQSLKLAHPSGETYLHGDVLYIDIPMIPLIEVWDLEKRIKLPQQYSYCEGEADYAMHMQAYDDKFLCLVHSYYYNTVYIWRREKCILLSKIKDESRINFFNFSENKLFYSTSAPQRELTMIRYGEI